MGLIKDFAEEDELPEFVDCWEQYRLLAANGIYRSNEAEIRNLHAQFSMLLSHKLLQQSTRKFETEKAKDYLEMDKNKLLYSKYSDDTAQKNLAACQNDPEYKISLDKKLEARRNELIFDAEVRALETIVFSLSRELSARLK